MIDYALLGRKVYKLYPYLAAELMIIPDLKDLGEIESLYAEYCSIQSDPTAKGQQTNHRMVFIAAILKLYDPDVLEVKKPMKNGLRHRLSKVIGCHHTVISHNCEIVRNYISIYPDFRNEVAYIYSELKKLHAG